MDKIIFNQEYIIGFRQDNIKIYENKNKINTKLILILSFNEAITDIEFNPILNNIILVLFFKGYWKIYKIEENRYLDKIIFEGINNKMIETSKFNYLKI